MKLITILVLLSFLNIASAASDKVKVDNLYLEFTKAYGTNTEDFNIPDRKISNYLNLGFNFTFDEFLFWNNKISSTISSAQFRKVGWEFEIGVVPVKGLEVYVAHESEHAMDMVGYKGSYPQMNSIGLRLNLIGGK